MPLPVTDNPQFNRLAESVARELFDLTQIHALHQQGRAHQRNRVDAQDILDALDRMLADAQPPDDEARDWLGAQREQAQALADDVFNREAVA